LTFDITMTAVFFSARTLPLLAALALLYSAGAFTIPYLAPRCPSRLRGAPKRLEENVDGVLYVNDKVLLIV
jgi:hypothetical protein